jgi:hypothetical protein
LVNFKIISNSKQVGNIISSNTGILDNSSFIGHYAAKNAGAINMNEARAIRLNLVGPSRALPGFLK